MLTDLERVHKAGFSVFELSAVPNIARADGGLVPDAIESLLDWMVDCKCAALGHPQPARGPELHKNQGLFVQKWEIANQMP